MKILFMGTPDFAVPCLEACMTFPGGEVIGVFTQPDRPKGRGHKLAPPPVKVLAEAKGITVYQPERLKTQENEVLIESLAPDVIVVVAYGQILSKKILDIPPLGCINVHGSLLPKYRGASPIQWSIVQGEKETGVTTMFMAEGLDTGDMIHKDVCAITLDMNAGELHDRLMAMGAETLKRTLAALQDGTAPREVQDDSLSNYAPILTKEMAVIDWNRSAQEIHDHVRGFNPWPVTFTELGEERVKVFETAVVDESLEKEALEAMSAGELVAGMIIATDGKGIMVKCGSGSIIVKTLQVGAGKRMSSADYLRGHGIPVGTCFCK